MDYVYFLISRIFIKYTNEYVEYLQYKYKIKNSEDLYKIMSVQIKRNS